MGLLVRIIHLVPSMVGLGVTIALIPCITLVTRRLTVIRRRLVGHTDARVKLCTEVVTGIKAVKLYAWERPYVERITALRCVALLSRMCLPASEVALYCTCPNASPAALWIPPRREEELLEIRKSTLLSNISSMMYVGAPIIISLAGNVASARSVT